MKKFVLNTMKTKRFIFGLVLGSFSCVLSAVLPLLIQKFINEFASSRKVTHFLIICALIILVMQTCCSAASTYLLSTLADMTISDLREKLFGHILHLPFSYFDKYKNGEVASRVVNDVAKIGSFSARSIPNLIYNLLTLSISMTVAVSLDAPFVVIVIGLILFIMMFWIPIGKRYERIGISIQSLSARLNAVVTDDIYAIRVVKENNAEKGVLRKFNNESRALLNVLLRVDLLSAVQVPLQTITGTIFFSGILAYGVIRLSYGALAVGTVAALIMYCFQMLNPVNQLATFYTQYKVTKGSVFHISEIFELSSESELQTNKDKANFSKLRDVEDVRLSLENAYFSYNGDNIIRNVSVEIRMGEQIAIVGDTGAGKSTIAKLLTRLYPLTDGSLYLDSVSSGQCSLSAWRHNFGVVSQDSPVINGTIRDNIMLGLEEEPSEQEFDEIVSLACLEDCCSLPKGLETEVGEQGFSLSGGQRQRIQIARACLRKPRFLILDEATSNLDAITEQKIMKNIKEKLNKSSLIIIAHRLSTIVNSSKIYYFDNGQVVGSGSHEELVSKLPKYRNNAQLQLI